MFQKPWCERFGKKYGFLMFNKIFDQCKGKSCFGFVFVIIDLMVRFHCDSSVMTKMSATICLLKLTQDLPNRFLSEKITFCITSQLSFKQLGRVFQFLVYPQPPGRFQWNKSPLMPQKSQLMAQVFLQDCCHLSSFLFSNVAIQSREILIYYNTTHLQTKLSIK